jgi:hypothetical protein
MARRPANPAVQRVATTYDDTVRAVRDRVVSYIARTWRGLENYRDADIDRFVARVVPIVLGGQRRISALTDAYLATVGGVVLGTSRRPVGIPANVIAYDTLRSGSTPEEVYARAGVTVWAGLTGGLALADAINKGLARATATAATDMQLARTHTARHVFGQRDDVVGYLRVPGGGHVCELCQTASDNLYRTDDLMPIHARCSCGIEPLFAGRGHDPGELDTPDATDERGAVAVHEHGELGPVLAVKGQHFTGPDDL